MAFWKVKDMFPNWKLIYHYLETLSNLFLQLGRIEKHGSNLTKTFYRQAVYILS